MSVEAWKSFFDIAAVVLLGLTFIAGAGVLLTGNVINRRQETKLLQFEGDITRAKSDLAKQQERAANADSRVAGLEDEASKQQERAAKAEGELLKLQRANADRSLSDAQIKGITDRLRFAAGQEFDVTAYSDSPESAAIANRIGEALQLARWKFLPMERWRGLLGGVVGVFVGVHPEADKSTQQAADELVTALLDDGIQCKKVVENPTNNPKHNILHLTVGSKR
jgi:hypothetical protein